MEIHQSSDQNFKENQYVPTSPIKRTSGHMTILQFTP